MNTIIKQKETLNKEFSREALEICTKSNMGKHGSIFVRFPDGKLRPIPSVKLHDNNRLWNPDIPICNPQIIPEFPTIIN